ncbi:DUF6708 domain-containing protein [Pseudomonas sp. SMSB3]|uniref:DUF6708 domain-containing protein n=1 Tax=Pseudomonas sp. SMSB3 TaxID=3390196 RepID=UPI003F8385D8
MSLRHRAPGWTHDLPNTETPVTQGEIRPDIDPPPNTINEVYLELPRSSIRIRGAWLLTGPTLIAWYLLYAIEIIYSNVFTQPSINLEIILTSIFIPAITVILLTPHIRTELGFPRDEPIRFNRPRRKVYFYQYRFSFLFPFSRSRWGLKPVAYDWDDITAEAYRVFRPGHGGLKEWVMLSVCLPGTKQVIDRLFLADDLEEGAQYWAIARLYMQEGPAALPTFAYPPEDWNEFPYPITRENMKHRNPIDRLAPKVEWPAEMDLESRSVPSGFEQL